MTYWFSPSTGAFGLDAWGKKKRPADALSISPRQHARLFPRGEPQREIEPGPDGFPRWKLLDPAETKEAVRVGIKREAHRRIEAIFPLTAQINSLRLGKTDDPRFADIDVIRAASNMIEQDLANSDDATIFPISDHPLWPASKDA